MNQEQYIDHEIRIRLQEKCCRQLNKKLDIIIGTCGAIFTVVFVTWIEINLVR